eukprot:TRINITY_DN13885_c0_g1_i1.p1 TRINITY_DN13885_c0_g1~~TRINITY_DN13885_c0_g1_i1.p1  ORF type:complete len:1117 (+),score=252.28 TRINITY_DN13885_c0_g1_i1:48-3353(+)
MTQKEPKELKEGLFLLESEDEEKLKVLAFENRTTEKQFICKYTFKEASVLKLGESTKKDGAKVLLSVHPGETLELARGKWSGLSKSIAVGPVSKEWMEGEVKKQYLINHSALAAARSLPKDPQHYIDTKTRFLDTDFPPIETSLQQSWQKGDLTKKYVFKRPSDWGIIQELGKHPKLFVDGIEPEDINQGALADCALIAVMTSIAQRKDLVKCIFGEDQHPEIGLYKLLMCKNGLWTVVVLDDYIPCNGGKPSFARNRTNPNELWISLLEKAYSKCLRSFSTLKSALCSYSFTDLTGCPNKNIMIDPSTECDELRSDYNQGALVVLGTPGKNLMSSKAAKESDQILWDKYRSVELICEHSYSVMGFEIDKGIIIVKMRNPWGTTTHGLWAGEYGPNDPNAAHLYERLSEAQKDGVFYMKWKDIAQWFNTCSVGYPLANFENIHVPGEWDSQGRCNKTIGVRITNDIPHSGEPKLWIGFHQEDIRGLEGHEFRSMNLYIVALSAKGNRVRVVESIGTSKRDRFVPINMRDYQGRQLLVVGQPKDPSSGKYVISLHTSSLDLLQVDFNGPVDGNLNYYASGKEVSFAHWEPTETCYQVKGNKLSNGKVLEKVSCSLGEVDIGSPKAFGAEIDQSHNESLMDMANMSAFSSPTRQQSVSSMSSCRQSSLKSESPNVSIQNMPAVGTGNSPSVATTPLDVSPSESPSGSIRVSAVTPNTHSQESTPRAHDPDGSAPKFATCTPTEQVQVVPTQTEDSPIPFVDKTVTPPAPDNSILVDQKADNSIASLPPQEEVVNPTIPLVNEPAPEEPTIKDPIPQEPIIKEPAAAVADADVVVKNAPVLVAENNYLDEPVVGERVGDSALNPVRIEGALGNSDYANEELPPSNNNDLTPIDTTDDEEAIKVDIAEGKPDDSEDEIEIIPYEGKLPDTPPSIPVETRPPRKSFFEAQKDLQQQFTGEEKEMRLEVQIIRAEGLSDKGSKSPYCEVKLRSVNKKTGAVASSHPNPQKKTTKTAKSLSPSWNETYNFVVPMGDCVRVSIFGKRTLGTKLFLGRVDITTELIKKMKAVPGAPPVEQKFEILGDDSNDKRKSVTGSLVASIKIISLR